MQLKKSYHVLKAMVQLLMAAFFPAKKGAAATIALLEELLAARGFASLSKQERKRIWFYVAQGAITGLWFSTLHSRKLTEAEQRAKRFVGAFTVFQDDLTDDAVYSYSNFLELMEGKEKHLAHHREEWLAWYTYQQVQIAVADPQLFKRISALVEKAQHDSRVQLSGNLTNERLMEITAQKGGTATLFYRCLVSPVPSPEEERFVLGCGELLQWCNDIFDVHKDYHGGVQTLFNHSRDLVPWRQAFMEKLLVLRSSLHQLPFRPAPVLAFWCQYLAIATRGLVCFDQLIALQKRSGGVFDMARYERKETICDMEQFGNLWKSFRYAVQFA
jgi:hypothetical protein